MNKLKSYNKILNIILQFLKSEIIKFRFRYRFYKSYKGSYRKVLIRIANNIYKKPQIENINPQGEINLVLSELNMAKERIKKELLKYK
jgi:hypothetical protein